MYYFVQEETVHSRGFWECGRLCPFRSSVRNAYKNGNTVQRVVET